MSNNAELRLVAHLFLNSAMTEHAAAAEVAEMTRTETQDDAVDDKRRFEIELEFIQSMANPKYLHCACASRSRISYGAVLAQEGHFEDAQMICYLDYLQYWHRPEYARFIQ
jgi:mediator of RNA polymerase II transcription subunit 31